MSDYQAAVKYDPSYALAHYNAGNIYLLHKQYAQVIFRDFFINIIEINLR